MRTACDNDDPLDAGNTAGLLVDGTGTVLGCTPAAEALLNRPADDLSGRRVRELLADPARWPDVLAQRDGPVWEGSAVVRKGGGGEADMLFRGTEILVRTRVDPRAGRIVALSAFRLQDPDGQVTGVTALFVDVTEQRRARERLDLLHRATVVLGSSLSLAETTADLVDVLVPALADAAAVDIAEAVFAPEEHRHARGRAAPAAPGGRGRGGRRARVGVPVSVDVTGRPAGRMWTAERPPAADAPPSGPWAPTPG